jgi:hypothetical protein
MTKPLCPGSKPDPDTKNLKEDICIVNEKSLFSTIHKVFYFWTFQIALRGVRFINKIYAVAK